MSTAPLFPNAPDVTAQDYCVFGVATCFVRQEGEVEQVEVVEPIPAAYLDALFKQVPTSYRLVSAKAIGEVITPDGFNLPAEFPETVQLSADFVERTLAASRTYKRDRASQERLPVGTWRDDFNYSLERKRLLNAERIVTAEDNVKQHSYTHQVL